MTRIRGMVPVAEAQARAAYDAHNGFLGGVRPWADLAPEEQAAWYAAAAAVLDPPKSDATPRPIDSAAGGHVERFDGGKEEP